MQFSTFDLEDTSWDGECNFDYVAVYEGRHEVDENLINKVCGTLPINKKQMISLKHNFIAETGEMFVKFFSDNTVSLRTFMLYAFSFGISTIVFSITNGIMNNEYAISDDIARSIE